MAHRMGFYEHYLKRPLDFICAACALAVLSPVMAVTAVLVKKELGSPVLFTQDRPGLDGRVFKLYKFRSMSEERDENGALLPDARRLSRFGRLLRSTSLDELPELFNILRGDMSLVGPRPLLVKYLAHYDSFERRRHEVRPGLTGLAQISGRNALNWKEKFRIDVEYVDHVSFWQDIRILLLTVAHVVKRDGIETGKGNQPVMDYFRERESGLGTRE